MSVGEDLFGDHNIDFIGKELVEQVTKGGELGQRAILKFSKQAMFSVECSIEYTREGKRELQTSIAYVWWSSNGLLLRGFSDFSGDLPDLGNAEWDSYSTNEHSGAVRVAMRSDLESIRRWHRHTSREHIDILTGVAESFVRYLDAKFKD